MPKRRGYRVKRRTHKEIDENNDDPKSFVVKRGPVGKSLGALVSNMREVMLPYSAKKLRESKATKLKDLISLSSHFHVTHVQMFTQKDSGVYYRVAGIPNGPTVTFQVKEFSLMSDVRSNQKRPRSVLSDFQLSPLVVLSGFRKNLDDSQNPQLGAGVTITAKVLTNMYPAVDVEKMNVSVCRRVVLYNRNPQTGLIEFRHYAVVSRSAGVSRAVRKLLSVNPNKIPKLGNKRDISEYIENAGAASDSEFEDTQEVSAVKRNKSSGHHTEQLALSLVELGPRMTLELVTVEEGVLGGDVVYSRSIKPEGAQSQRKNVIKEEDSDSLSEEEEEDFDYDSNEERDDHDMTDDDVSEEEGDFSDDDEEEEDDE